MRRVGVVAGQIEGDQEAQARLAALREGLAKLGWIEGRNLTIDVRIGGTDLNRFRAAAAELVRLAPEAVVVTTTPATRALQQEAQTIPIVFVNIGDPVLSRVVGSIARPEGNVTGFSNFEPSLGGKWLELLKEAAPHITRTGLVFSPDLYTGNHFAAIEATAPVLGVQAIKVPIHDGVDVVRALDAFAAEPNGALLVLPDIGTTNYRGFNHSGGSTAAACRNLYLEIHCRRRRPDGVLPTMPSTNGAVRQPMLTASCAAIGCWGPRAITDSRAAPKRWIRGV